VDYLEVKGEVKALRSVIIAAPYGAGDLQIMKLATNGAKVKKGDVLVEFDNTTVKQKLAQDQSALKSAEAEIQQSRAAARLKEEQDLTDVMKAQVRTLRRRRLDARNRRCVSVIEAGGQTEARGCRAKGQGNRGQLKADHPPRRRILPARKQKLDQQLFRCSRRRAQPGFACFATARWSCRAPESLAATGGPTPFKPGDRAWPVAALQSFPIIPRSRFPQRIEEAERGQLKLGQSGKVRVDAVPEGAFEGRIDTISPTAAWISMPDGRSQKLLGRSDISER